MITTVKKTVTLDKDEVKQAVKEYLAKKHDLKATEIKFDVSKGQDDPNPMEPYIEPHLKGAVVEVEA